MSNLETADWLMIAFGIEFIGVWGAILLMVRKYYFKKR